MVSNHPPTSGGNAYRFLAPVEVKDDKGNFIGSYQQVMGAGNPEDPLYIMNFFNADEALIATMTVFRSYSLFQNHSEPHAGRFEQSIPASYMKAAAPAIIANEGQDLATQAHRLADALEKIQDRFLEGGGRSAVSLN